MKNKNIIIITISVVLFIINCVGLYFIIKQEKQDVSAETIKIQAYKINNEREYLKELSNINILVNGKKNDIINKEFINNNRIKAYEFDAGIKTEWNEYTNHFVGFKLKDIVASLALKDYKQLTFVNVGSVRQVLNKENINDNMYIVIMRDGQKIDNKDYSLILFDQNYEKSLEGIFEIFVN